MTLGRLSLLIIDYTKQRSKDTNKYKIHDLASDIIRLASNLVHTNIEA